MGKRFVDADRDGFRELHYDADYLQGKSGYSITLRLAGVRSDVGVRWELVNADTGSIVAGESRSTSTTEQITLNVDRVGLYYVKMTFLGVSGVAPLVTTIDPKDLLIVAMGDSFAAGEGNPEVESKSDPKWGDAVGSDLGSPADQTSLANTQRAHRSSKAASALAAAKLEDDDPHSAVTYLHLGVSGAAIRQFENPFKDDGSITGGGLLEPQLTWADGTAGPAAADPSDEPGPDPRTQVGAAKALLGSRKIDSLYLSIGINDVGFGDIAAEMVTGGIGGDHSYLSGLANKIQDRVADSRGNYALLANAIDSLGVGRVFITGYPNPTSAGSGETITKAMDDIAPGLEWDSDEINWVRDFGMPTINGMVQTAAKAHGWTFVDTSAGFVGHGLRVDQGGSGKTTFFRDATTSVAIQGPDLAEVVGDGAIWGGSLTAFLASGLIFVPNAYATAIALGAIVGGAIQDVFELKATNGTIHPNNAGHQAVATALLARMGTVPAQLDWRSPFDATVIAGGIGLQPDGAVSVFDRIAVRAGDLSGFLEVGVNGQAVAAWPVPGSGGTVDLDVGAAGRLAVEDLPAGVNLVVRRAHSLTFGKAGRVDTVRGTTDLQSVKLIVVDDSKATVARTLTVTADTVNGLPFALDRRFNDKSLAVQLKTGSANDTVTVTGPRGTITTLTGAGNDTVHVIGGGGSLTVNGGIGTDTLKRTVEYPATASWFITRANGGTAGSVRFDNMENLVGSSAADQFHFYRGGSVGGKVSGGGGPGIDLINYSNWRPASGSGGVYVNLAVSKATGTGSVSGIEDVTGSGYNDILVGSLAANVMNGGPGIDLIVGRDGKDRIRGNEGTDLIITGRTLLDSDVLALKAVLADHARGLNGSRRLAGQVVDDGVSDVVFGDKFDIIVANTTITPARDDVNRS